MSDTIDPRHKKVHSPLALILQASLRYWYWFLVTVPLFVAGGYFYTKTLSYNYQADALILLHNGEAGQSMAASKQALFEDMGMPDSNTSVENEIVQLKSSQIIGKVVDKIELNIQYHIKPLFRRTNIYGANPVAVKIVEQTEKKIPDLLLRPVDTQSYLYAILAPGQSSKELSDSDCKSAKYGQEIVVDNNILTVETTQYWGNGYLGNDILVSFYNKAECIEEIKRNITIARTDKVTNTVKLTYQSGNQKLGEDLLNTLIATYEAEIIAQKNYAALSAEQFIAERISAIYKSLGEVDDELADYKATHDIVSVENVSTSAFAREAKYEELISGIDLQLTMITAVSKTLEETDSYKPIPPNKAFVELSIHEQIDTFNGLVIKYNDLRQNAGANNPVVVRLRQEIATSRDNTQVAIQNLVANLKLQREQYVDKEKLAEEKIAALPEKEKAVKDVMREQGIIEQLYLFLLNAREENALNLAMTESNLLIIEPAQGTGLPVSPRIPVILLASATAGFILPAFGIFLLSLLHNKVESLDDIETACSIPVIGQLPRQKKSKNMQEYCVQEDSRDILAENFRIITNNLDYFRNSDSQRGQVIQITSTLPGEGKTTMSHNIALSLSFSNKRVIMLDGDLRKRSLSKRIKPDSSQLGLLSYLGGKTDKIEEIAHRSKLSKTLYQITLRSIPPNASSLLSSPRYTQLIEELRNHFDYIVIDTPPFYAVADAQQINKHADITLWVIGAGKIHKGSLRELDELYRNNKINNLTILLNNAEKRNQGYGYGYGYGYAYGYGGKDKKKS